MFGGMSYYNHLTGYKFECMTGWETETLKYKSLNLPGNIFI